MRRRPPPRTNERARLSRAARATAGKRLRMRVPRSIQGTWTPPNDRPDPIDLLRASDRRRIASLVPIRYGRMSASPFAFLRGAAAVMAHDLAGTPTTGLRVQLAGDAHLSNFGVFATPERDRVFDVNDFDETLPGPFEWDVKRLATSLVLLGRQNGCPAGTSRRAVRAAMRSYRQLVGSFARSRYLDTWYSHIDLDSADRLVRRAGRRVIGDVVRRARARTGLHAFPRMVETVRGGYRIRDDPPLIVHYSEAFEETAARTFYARYVASLPEERRMLLDRYHLADVAQKVVGVGSVGTACSVMLLMGDRDVVDPLFLQMKEAFPSVLEPFAGASRYASPAERVVTGQHLIQEASDALLGWGRLGSRDLYVRQLRDMKFSSEAGALGPKGLLGHGELCGAALARAHARTGDPAAIAGYLGVRDLFDRALVRFAEAYADQTERDHAALRRAIRRGRVEAKRDI
ncbi:MAG: DUF2252 domain-containing protein [Thermoplasmata archaeon]